MYYLCIRLQINISVLFCFETRPSSLMNFGTANWWQKWANQRERYYSDNVNQIFEKEFQKRIVAEFALHRFRAKRGYLMLTWKKIDITSKAQSSGGNRKGFFYPKEYWLAAWKKFEWEQLHSVALSIYSLHGCQTESQTKRFSVVDGSHFPLKPGYRACREDVAYARNTENGHNLHPVCPCSNLSSCFIPSP